MLRSPKYDIQVNKVLDNFSHEIRRIKGRTEAGLLEAVNEVKKNSMKRVPVKSSNLKNSHYSFSMQTSEGPYAEVGLTAHYAVKIHEDLTLNLRNGQHKYLENAVLDEMGNIRRIVTESARL